jgi:hypothetical protein
MHPSLAKIWDWFRSRILPLPRSLVCRIERGTPTLSRSRHLRRYLSPPQGEASSSTVLPNRALPTPPLRLRATRQRDLSRTLTTVGRNLWRCRLLESDTNSREQIGVLRSQFQDLEDIVLGELVKDSPLAEVDRTSQKKYKSPNAANTKRGPSRAVRAAMRGSRRQIAKLQRKNPNLQMKRLPSPSLGIPNVLCLVEQACLVSGRTGN